MPTSSTSNDPARRAEAREDLVRVRAAIRELPDEQREVFLLRQNGELPYERIADTLGIPVNTAKTRMRRALLRLRAAIEVPPSPSPARPAGA
jgi:RNA polymerase sigma-70 factor (ECF subfamily)